VGRGWRSKKGGGWKAWKWEMGNHCMGFDEWCSWLMGWGLAGSGFLHPVLHSRALVWKGRVPGWLPCQRVHLRRGIYPR